MSTKLSEGRVRSTYEFIEANNQLSTLGLLVQLRYQLNLKPRLN